ncbi:MAG TPA: hypothetical protein VHD87_00275, partial [Acidimicrobiales bacterium]|nr:hypothetical protein [Acidimicrobiales bacterium]
MDLVTHKTLQFARPRAEVWAAMGDVGSYQRWWPWLRAFEARALASGEAWHCTVRPPLPYTVTFIIAFEDVVAERHAHAHVSGDVAGDATLTLDDADDGCVV